MKGDRLQESECGIIGTYMRTAGETREVKLGREGELLNVRFRG